MGDPAGIGPDITLAAFEQRKTYNLPPFFLIAEPNTINHRVEALGARVEIVDVDPSGLAPMAWTSLIGDVFEKALPLIAIDADIKVETGVPSTDNAGAILQSIERATDYLLLRNTRAIVTNPIAKSVLYGQQGFEFQGHTDFLAMLASSLFHPGPYTPVMMLAADEMRVVPATIHIPLRDVPDALTKDGLKETLEIVCTALKSDFGCDNPRVACTGLNPHAGESGALGREDDEIIAPVVAAMRRAGHDVSGPWPADTLFHAEARSRYDVIVAMYHDQALIPIKTVAFDRGVNVTLGLPFVRTSPDHGTAFDIAGTGSANPRSLIEAIRMADQIQTRRGGPLVS